MTEFEGMTRPLANGLWQPVVWRAGYDRPGGMHQLGYTTYNQWEADRRVRRWLHAMAVARGPKRERMLQEAGL